MQRIGLAERSALGVRRMYEALLVEGKGPPEYRSTAASVTITLRNGAFDRPFAGLIRSLRDEGFDLSVFELLILNHLRRSSRLTLADAALLCQQSTEGTRRLLDRLTEQELLLREGSGVEPSWVLGPRSQSSQVPSR
jgi:ATP-dependent DNA helicase RecG